jgi:hypothetical protein
VATPASAANQYYDSSATDGLTPGNATWDAGTTAAWADSATPGTTSPVAWVNGNDAFFQTGGSSTVTLAGEVSAASLQQVSGTTTLAGGGSLSLTSGNVTLSGGTLIIGSGTGGKLPDGCAIAMSSGTTLNFGRSDAGSWSGRINGVAAIDGTVSKTGTGDFNLTLQGNNAFGTVTNGNVPGLLVLSTATPADEISATIRATTGSAMAITSGIWKTPNLGQNNTGVQMRGTLTLSNATVNVTTSGRYTTGSFVIQSGGVLRIENDRFEYNTSQSVPAATMEIQNGGLLDVYSNRYGTTLGAAASTTSIIRQTGGTARCGVTDGLNTSNRDLKIGGTNTHAKAAYELSGGTLLVRGTLQSGGVTGSGGINNFNFRGGTLAANAIATANLGSSSNTADPVFDSDSVGTLVNRGGTLAPGDVGPSGKTTITGAFQVDSGSLAIDIGGTSAATAFQGAISQFDNVAVSGGVVLGGTLAVHLRNGFTPVQTDSFTILSAGSVTGAFTNVDSAGRVTCLPSHGSFLVTVSGNAVVLSDYQPDPDAGPDIIHAPQTTGVLVGGEVYLSVVVSGEGEVSFQWRRDGVAIEGATGTSYRIETAGLADAGAYDVVVTDATGSRTSAAATLTVVPQGEIDPLVAASPYGDKTVWSYHDSVPVPWSIFKPRDYGSSQIQFDGQGVTSVGRVPAPGVHPRVFFGPDDLPAIRQRIQNTTGGQEAWKNLLSYCHYMKRTYDKNQDYAKPWWYVNYFSYTGRNPHLYRVNGTSTEDYHTILADGGTPTSFASEPSFFFKAASMEALRCLIEDDAAGGEKLARAVVRSIQIEQARRSTADTPSNPPKPSTPRANCSSLGLVYDFAYNFMTPAQRDFVRQELVLLSAWADNYGTFNNAEASRSNWATFSYWVFDLMAIEGEPGFNDLKFLGLYRGWRNYFTYSFFDSGAAFEAEGKLPLGFDAMIAFDRVGWKYGLAPLAHHPMVRSYYSKFLPFSVLPARDNQFVIFDILGGLGGALTTPADLVAAKFLYPNDKLVDFSYRSLVKDDYRNIPSAIHFHWNEQAVSAITATTYDPANEPAALNTPLSFVCGQRAMMMTRSSWDTDASFLTMHVRGASGGHPYPDRNGIMFAGKGRSWITIPNKDIGGWSMNTVLIDEAQQSHTTPARVVDYVDQPNATFMAGDAKYSWDWVWATSDKDKQGNPCDRDDVLSNNVDTGASGWSLVNQSFNDFARDQSSRPVFQQPMKFSASWIAKDGILTPYKRMVNTPVLKSFRTAGLVRGPRPYALVVDDIQRDGFSASYDWNATMRSDVVQVTSGVSGETGDLVFAAQTSVATDGSLKPNEPGLLVRVLNANGQPATPTFLTRGGYKHLAIRSNAVAPDFKILIHAFRMGDSLPQTTWNSNRSGLTVSFPDQTDIITFTAASSGKTDVVVSRSGNTLAAVTAPVAPLADAESAALTASLQDIPARVAQLRGSNYDPATRPGFLAGWNFGQTKEVAGVGPAFMPVAGSIAAAAPIPATGVELVSGMNGSLAASLATPGITASHTWTSQLANSFTIAFWMKANTLVHDNVFFAFGDHRTLLLRYRSGFNLAALGNWYLDAGPATMATSWTHLAAVFTGTQLQIFRNGHLVSSYAATPASFQSFANMKLGVLNGAVQSVHFYNTAFTTTDVQDLHLWGRYGQLADPVPDPSLLEIWRQSHFGTTENTGNAADSHDHDGDGLCNLVEYALGGDPTAAGDAPRPTMIMVGDSPRMLRFSFHRARSDVTYTVEQSADLTRWDPLDTNPGNVGETVVVETPADGGRRFLRLRVVDPP